MSQDVANLRQAVQFLRLIEKTEGTILFNGEMSKDVDKKKLRELRTKMQIISVTLISSPVTETSDW